MCTYIYELKTLKCYLAALCTGGAGLAQLYPRGDQAATLWPGCRPLKCQCLLLGGGVSFPGSESSSLPPGSMSLAGSASASGAEVGGSGCILHVYLSTSLHPLVFSMMSLFPAVPAVPRSQNSLVSVSGENPSLFPLRPDP